MILQIIEPLATSYNQIKNKNTRTFIIRNEIMIKLRTTLGQLQKANVSAVDWG